MLSGRHRTTVLTSHWTNKSSEASSSVHINRTSEESCSLYHWCFKPPPCYKYDVQCLVRSFIYNLSPNKNLVLLNSQRKIEITEHLPFWLKAPLCPHSLVLFGKTPKQAKGSIFIETSVSARWRVPYAVEENLRGTRLISIVSKPISIVFVVIVVVVYVQKN